VCCAIYPHLPVRPLLIKYTVSTVSAADRLAALERDVHVAVAALVVYGARGCVDGAGGRGVRGGLLGIVCRGHFKYWVLSVGEDVVWCGVEVGRQKCLGGDDGLRQAGWKTRVAMARARAYALIDSAALMDPAIPAVHRYRCI
jgi:hypothetical protein